VANLVVDTIAYYDRNAAKFAEETADLDLGHIYEKFLHYVGPHGSILDVGCGIGRDAFAFANRGYEVVAFDASTALVELARARIKNRCNVYVMRFEDITWHGQFDGIWACASLVHVPEKSLADVLSRLAKAMRPGGSCYMSFKLGEKTRIDHGRLFVDHTEKTLRHIVTQVPMSLVETWITLDVRANRRGERWLNAIAVHS
jgi:SAM-dependent methyltransferase